MKLKVLFAILSACILCGCGGKKAEEGKVTINASGIGAVAPFAIKCDLRNDNPGCELYGFSGNEGHGRWSDADVSAVVIPSLPAFETATIKINVTRTPINAMHPSTDFDIVINDRMAMEGCHYETDGDHQINIVIDKSWVNEEGALSVRFDHKKPYVVNEFDPTSADTRRINCAVGDITVYGFAIAQ